MKSNFVVLTQSKIFVASSLLIVIAIALLLALVPHLGASPRAAAQAAQEPLTPKGLAPEDLTGYWVSVVTQDWRFRMLTPPKGDFGEIPVNQEARRVMADWDSSKDEAANEQCKSYGPPALLTVPERLHIYWENDSTLRLDTDAGMQTRLFHFTAAPPQGGVPQLQGFSVASWEGLSKQRADRTNNEIRAPQQPGYLKVMTTKMRPGYLRKNGVPYGADAVLEEDFDRLTEMNGDTWLVVTIILKDPQYLAHPFMNTIPFKLVSNNSGWNPIPCEAK